MTTTKDQLILEVWKNTGSDIVSAPELESIQQALSERFGAESSPASIARVLADDGARLGHPEILQSDTRWREQQYVFTPDDLAFDSIDAAFGFIEKLQQAHDQPSLRESVQQIKQELDVLVAMPMALPKRRAVAREAAQWLTIWLQNPLIFSEWLDLRRSTAEFQELFGTFPPA
jgi:hypothetical protein